MLKALVDDVILETRQVEGQAKPPMVARFTINDVPRIEFQPEWFDIASDETPEGVKPDVSRDAYRS